MPGIDLPAGTTVSYADYEFPVSLEPVKCDMDPVKDSAGRVVTAMRYRFTLSAIIYPLGVEASAVTQMANLRTQLSKPACRLEVSGTGFGNLIVNDRAENVWDAAWGPWPQVVALTQVGDDMAWKLVWTVVTLIPEDCPEKTRPGQKRAMEWCYDLTWNVNEKGLTTRTMVGHVVIPLTRPFPTSRKIPDSADSLREAVARINIPFGFRRTPGVFKLSEDRRRLDFTITDVQRENAFCPPAGVIDVQARHDFSNAGQYNFFKNVNTLTASYTVAQDAPKSVAWDHFVALYLSRRAVAINDGATVIPLTLTGGEAIYDQTSTFTLRYAVFYPVGDNNAKKQRFIERLPFFQGLWKFPPQSDFIRWAESLYGGAWHPRGYARMAFANEDDSLRTVCDDGPLPKLDPKVKDDSVPVKISDPDGGRRRPGGGGGGGPPGGRLIPVEVPPKNRSHLQYDVRLRVIPKEENTRLKLLPPDGEPVKYRPKPRNVNEDGGYEPEYVPPKSKPHVIQQRAEPSYLAVFEGEVVRVGHTIPIPALTEIAGVKVHPWDEDGQDYANMEVIGNLLVPVYVAAWRQTYLLETTPAGKVLPPDAPLEGRAPGGDRLEGFVVSASGS